MPGKITKYDPQSPPDPDTWSAMDEFDLVEMILRYHRREEVDVPNEEIHAHIHLIVENQVALGDATPVAVKIEELMAEGLDRHQAIHAVGCVMAEHLWALSNDDTPADGDMSPAYFEDVRNLTAQHWWDLAE